MRTSESFMQVDEKGRFCHEAKHPKICRMYSTTQPIHAVRITESEEETGYWAWWSNHDNWFTMVYPVLAAVEICFAYGSKAEEDRGRGKVCRVKIEDLGKVAPV